MQNQKNWNDSSNAADFSDEQLLLNGQASCNISGRSSALTTRPEPTLSSSDDFFTTPQASNISSNLFSINANTAMEPSILSTEYASIENIWDGSISARANVPNTLPLIEQNDSNSSVGSFSNPPPELLKAYSRELPSIMEDSTSEQSKPKSKRQRRNSLPLGSRSTKRKLSTGSDITNSINECEQNSSNSSCDIAGSVESSDILNTPAWTRCYSPYRRRTPSVASSEKGATSLINKLFTEEEKQRYLAAKKKSQNVEQPNKKIKYLGLLGSEDKFFMNNVACTSSLTSSLLGDTILSKNDTPLQTSDNPVNLFKSDDEIIFKPSIESEISVVSSDTQLIDLIANPIISENLNFFSELKTPSLEAIVDPTNQQNTNLLCVNVPNETSETNAIPATVSLVSDVTTEISVVDREFDLTTESLENQFVSSVEIGEGTNISNEKFSNVENSDCLENIYNAPQTSENNDEQQANEVPFMFVSENLLSSVKPFDNVTSTDYKETNTVLTHIPIENSASLEQENSGKGKNYSVIDSDCKLPLSSTQLAERLCLQNLHEQEAEFIQYQEETVSAVSYIDDNENFSQNGSANCETEVAEEVIYTSSECLERQECISESQEAQNTIEAPTMDLGYQEIYEAMLQAQGISVGHQAQGMEVSDVDYLVLHKTLLEGNGESGKIDIGNNQIVIVAEEFSKIGEQGVDLEAVQEVPNILELNRTVENQCFEPGGLETGGFANGANQVYDISLEMYKTNSDNPVTEELTFESCLYPEDSCTIIENGNLLPNSIPITSGELEMLSFYANLEAKRSSKAKKSFPLDNATLNSPDEECPKAIENENSSITNNELIESEVVPILPLQASVLQNEDEMLNSSVAKKSCGGSRRASSESSNSNPRSSSDSCERHNCTDSSSSADESDSVPSKRKTVRGTDYVNSTLATDDNLTSSNSSTQRKTALKTFKKPFTVAKKSVDEKTAFKSVIQTYFGVRTALKTCSKASNSKGRKDKNGSAIIISLQNNSDVEISPEEFSADEGKSCAGSWSPLKDLPFLKSTCQCTADAIPCLCNGETLQLTCEAEDCVDGSIIPCTKNVTYQCLLTPSTNIKHRAFCDIHVARLRKHHCCPRCGLFCTQGTFLHCLHSNLKYGKENHLFHPSCFIIPDTGLPPSCPHCSKFSDFSKVQLSLIDSSDTNYSSRKSSVHPEGKNLMREFENYQLLMTVINKEDIVTTKITNVLVKNSDEVFSKEVLHTMLMTITKENSLSLRPTGKCLFNPIKNGDVKKVMQLIVNGVDPNHKFKTHKNNTPLHIASFYGWVGIVHLLLQFGALIDAANDDLETPLLLAVGKNHLAVVRCLLLSGAQVDAKNENGSTAFHLAAKSNYIEIAKLLFDTGHFDVNVKDDEGWTPLVWACEHNFINLVQWLLTLGADPNIQDREENTALHWAACSGDCEILEMLLENGSNLTFVNERGDSALHVAARKDHHACVKVLLSKGASLDCKNKDGETPNICCDNDSKSFRIFKKHSLNSMNSEKSLLQQHVVYRDISRGAETYPIQAVNEVDQEEFIMEFRYITRNCYMPDISVVTTIDSMDKCSCKDNCNSGSCTCTKNIKCWYDMDERLNADFDMCDPPVIYECSKICHCPKTCINRVVQKGLRIPLQLFRTFDRGWGVRTLKSLPKGTFICEYIGEVITGIEIAERDDDSYLFDLESKDGDYCIDGRFYSNVARFINHSCEPNLVSIRVFVEHQDINFPRIAFFTMRNVEAFEELCFDYGTEFWVAKSHTVLCTCSSSLCKYSKDSIDDTLQAYACEKETKMSNM